MKKTLVALALSTFAASTFAFDVVKTDNGQFSLGGYTRLSHEEKTVVTKSYDVGSSSYYKSGKTKAKENKLRLRLDVKGWAKASEDSKVGFHLRFQDNWSSTHTNSYAYELKNGVVTLKEPVEGTKKKHDEKRAEVKKATFFFDYGEYGKFTLGVAGLMSLGDSDISTHGADMVGGFKSAYGLALGALDKDGESSTRTLEYRNTYSGVNYGVSYSDNKAATGDTFKRTWAASASYGLTPEVTLKGVAVLHKATTNKHNTGVAATLDTRVEYAQDALNAAFNLGYGVTRTHTPWRGALVNQGKGSYLALGAKVGYKVHDLFSPYASLGYSHASVKKGEHSEVEVGDTPKTKKVVYTEGKAEKTKTVYFNVGFKSTLFTYGSQSLVGKLEYALTHASTNNSAAKAEENNSKKTKTSQVAATLYYYF